LFYETCNKSNLSHKQFLKRDHLDYFLIISSVNGCLNGMMPMGGKEGKKEIDGKYARQLRGNAAETTTKALAGGLH